MTTLSIIIVSYNTKKLLQDCLESIKHSLAKDSIKAQIIIVDNNSSDGTQEYLKQLTVDNQKLTIKIVLNDENFGFARAVNQGINQSDGKHLLLLNSDIRVLTGSIVKLIEVVEKKKNIGLAAPKLLNKDGKTSQPSCYNQPTIKRAFQEYWLKKAGSFEKYLPRGGHPIMVEAVVGAAMLIPRTTIDVVGQWNEAFFMYYEDLDFCQRVRKTGLKVCYVPQAKMIHHHGASSKRKPNKANRYLVESSKRFHGPINYFLITSIIRISGFIKKPYFIALLLSTIITVALLTVLIFYFR
ncbi:MAG: glycosyltransferase family 2 protein [Candidatus Shapirobacteria bacterium]|nr:glycosyltransferase family 2 protein [Candidatus Shapirobacteria bacterium]